MIFDRVYNHNIVCNFCGESKLIASTKCDTDIIDVGFHTGEEFLRINHDIGYSSILCRRCFNKCYTPLKESDITFDWLNKHADPVINIDDIDTSAFLWRLRIKYQSNLNYIFYIDPITLTLLYVDTNCVSRYCNICKVESIEDMFGKIYEFIVALNE